MLFFVLPMFSLSAYASTNEHSIGANIGYGGLDYNGQNKFSGDMLIGDLYYRYMPKHNFGLEIGYKSAIDGIGSTLVNAISEVSEDSFSGPRLSGYTSYALGSGFELYGKAGVTYYTYKYTYKENGQSNDIDQSSIGGEVSAGIGWNYKHFGISAEYLYSKNEDFDLGGIMFGTRLRF